MNDIITIKNCRLYSSKKNDELSDIKIEGSIITRIASSGNRDDEGQTVDAGGRIATPGFIDVHIQGAGGADVLDNTEEALRTISATLARVGTTGFLGTTVVKPKEDNAHLKLMRSFTGRELGGAKLLGIHLEGPFINIKKKGGLAEDAIYPSSPGELEEILDATGDSLKMMTIAPELPGNLQIIRELVKNGVIASFAHSDASYEEVKEGFNAGISHVTHIFNAMPPLHHRAPGPLSAIFENDKVSVQIISDGHHLHPSIVNLIYKLVGEERCICITDGMHGIGLPDGRYIYNGREYESRNGAARYLDGTLIGSTMSLGNIAFKFMEFTGCGLEAAVNSVTKNPAALLKMNDRIGSLETGKSADIVILNPDNSVYKTFVDGKIVFSKI